MMPRTHALLKAFVMLWRTQQASNSDLARAFRRMRWVERRFVSPLRGSTEFHNHGRCCSVGWRPRLRLCQRSALSETRAL